MTRRSEAERVAFCDQRADQMRHFQTPAEMWLWHLLVNDFAGWWTQHPIHGTTKNRGRWSYIADFAHPVSKLLIECDGSAHRKTRGRDRRRDTRLAGEGWRTLRVTNREVLTQLDQVRERIRQALEEGDDG